MSVTESPPLTSGADDTSNGTYLTANQQAMGYVVPLALLLYIISEMYEKGLISIEQKLALKYYVFTNDPKLVEFCH